MRLGRLTADATIVFDGDVDVASKPVARATGLLAGRADPPARLDLRDTAPRPRPSARSSTSSSFVDHAGPSVQYIERHDQEDLAMDLRQIRYFIAVAEERSFTVAARRLNLSQPPLSQQIQSLEAALGAQLLYRTSRRVELTQAGEALLARARAIQQQIKLAEEEVRSIGAGLVGTLDIGATGSILRGRLADLLAAYRKDAPSVKMTVHEQAPALQIAALLNRTTNISLNRSIPTEDALSSELAWQEEVVVAMPKAHPLARRKRIALCDLASEDHIVLQPESSQFARYIQTCCIDAGFLPRVSQQVVDAQSVPSLIAAGFGVALVPQSIARFTTDEIVFRPIRPSPPSADVFLVFRKDETSTVVQNFIKLARRFLRQKRNSGHLVAGR
jgi:DNA-binding transcriptional LysR family regulator